MHPESSGAHLYFSIDSRVRQRPQVKLVKLSVPQPFTEKKFTCRYPPPVMRSEDSKSGNEESVEGRTSPPPLISWKTLKVIGWKTSHLSFGCQIANNTLFYSCYSCVQYRILVRGRVWKLSEKSRKQIELSRIIAMSGAAAAMLLFPILFTSSNSPDLVKQNTQQVNGFVKQNKKYRGLEHWANETWMSNTRCLVCKEWQLVSFQKFQPFWECF